MNDEDMIADLKQFITAAIRQEVSGIKTDVSDLKTDVSDLKTDVSDLKTATLDLRTELKADIARLDKKIEDFASGIGDAIASLDEHAQQRTDSHEIRITKLEQRAI